MWGAFKALSLSAKLFVLGAILAVLVAVGFAGYQKGINVSKVEIERYKNASLVLKQKLDKAQNKVDVRIVTEYKDRVAYVDKVVYKTRDVVRTNVVSNFKFTKGWIYAYNQSVQGLEVDPVLASDKTIASVSDVDALADTIIPNNGISLSNQAKLDALQKWVRETEASRKENLDEK